MARGPHFLKTACQCRKTATHRHFRRALEEQRHQNKMPENPVVPTVSRHFHIHSKTACRATSATAAGGGCREHELAPRSKRRTMASNRRFGYLGRGREATSSPSDNVCFCVGRCLGAAAKLRKTAGASPRPTMTPLFLRIRHAVQPPFHALYTHYSIVSAAQVQRTVKY